MPPGSRASRRSAAALVAVVALLCGAAPPWCVAARRAREDGSGSGARSRAEDVRVEAGIGETTARDSELRRDDAQLLSGSLLQARSGASPRRLLHLALAASPLLPSATLAQEQPTALVWQPGQLLEKAREDVANGVLPYALETIRKLKLAQRPSGAPTKLIARLDGDEKRHYLRLRDASMHFWRFDWVWTPTLYVWMSGELSELSGIYALENLDATRAKWCRLGGGPSAAIFYKRDPGEHAVLRYHPRLGHSEAFIVDFADGSDVHNRGNAQDGSEAEGDDGHTEDGARTEAREGTGGSGASAPRRSGDRAAAAKAKFEDLETEVGGFSMKAPNFPGEIVLVRRGKGRRHKEFVEAVLELQPGMYWEGMPIYRSAAAVDNDDDDKQDKWMISAGGRWRYAEVPAGMTFSDLVMQGFFHRSGPLAKGWKYSSLPHSGKGPLVEWRVAADGASMLVKEWGTEWGHDFMTVFGGPSPAPFPGHRVQKKNEKAEH